MVIAAENGSTEILKLLLSLGAAIRSDTAIFAEGTRVEVNYKGKGKYYPGVIKKVHTDGTFDIDEDDGEKEYKVSKEMLRAQGVSFFSLMDAHVMSVTGIQFITFKGDELQFSGNCEAVD